MCTGRFVAGLAVVLVLAGCGSPAGRDPAGLAGSPALPPAAAALPTTASEWPAPETLGACSPEIQAEIDAGTTVIDYMILPEWLYRHGSWIEARRLFMGPARHEPETGLEVVDVDVTGAALLHGPDMGRARIRAGVAASVQSELDRGATVLLGLTDDGMAAVVASLRPDGAAAFIGPCESHATHALGVFATGHAGRLGQALSPAQVLRALVTAPDGELAQLLWQSYRSPEPVPWAERPPAARALDVEETPPEVLDGLYHIWLRVSLPAGWRGLSGILSTKASLGWNTSFLLNARPGSGDQFETTIYAVPGEDLELWLLDGNDYSAPLVALGHIPAERIRAAADGHYPGLVIQLAGAEDAGSLTDLVREVRQGQVVLQVIDTDGQ